MNTPSWLDEYVDSGVPRGDRVTGTEVPVLLASPLIGKRGHAIDDAPGVLEQSDARPVSDRAKLCHGTPITAAPASVERGSPVTAQPRHGTNINH